jgi:tRNA-modifying protein YgfZ
MPINISTCPAIFGWRPTAWLRVIGADAESFLQGQFTNDLRALKSARAVYGLWLNVKGKVLADSFVLRGAVENEFWIGSYFSLAAVIRERLESYVIADDVTIDDQTLEWTAMSALGPGSARLLDLPLSAAHFAFPGRRERDENIEWVFRMGADEPAWAEPGATRLDADEMARRRISAAIPAVPIDVGPADLPNEAGLEADAISYTKGCYLGQEVMARLKSMGQVRRRLLRVAGSGEIFPALPAPVFAGPRQIGELRSAVRDNAGGWIGLAMVSLLHVKPDSVLAFAAEGPPALRLLDSP